MSIPLPTVSLANVAINQSGTVSFANVGISAGGVSANPANTQSAGTILIFNESGSGLLIKFNTSQSGFYLPAGAWQPIPIKAGETGYVWTVIYNLPSPPVTFLLTTYYYPGEPIPSQPTLGNSPIGIGGTVQTSSVQTLSNEGSPPNPVLVIDIGNTTITQLITVNNDGSGAWNILIGGTAHQLLKMQNTFHSLLLGNASDVVEVLGALSIDLTLKVVGSSSFDNGAITSDGNGNLSTSVSGSIFSGGFTNAAGQMTAPQQLATPYLFENNVTLAVGTTAVQVANIGGIPINAKFVAIACVGTCASAGGYVQAGPHGATFTNQSTYPTLYECQVNNNISVGNAIVGVDFLSSKIDLKVVNAQMTNFSASVYAYWA